MTGASQQWDTPSGHVRMHVTALEAAAGGEDPCSPIPPGQANAEVLSRVSSRHGTLHDPAVA